LNKCSIAGLFCAQRSAAFFIAQLYVGAINGCRNLKAARVDLPAPNDPLSAGHMLRRILATKLAEDGTAVLEFFARHLKQILDDCELTVPEAGDRLKLGIIDPAARQDVLADMDADHLAEHHIQRKTRLG
jgi:hypothetical protein